MSWIYMLYDHFVTTVLATWFVKVLTGYYVGTTYHVYTSEREDESQPLSVVAKKWFVETKAYGVGRIVRRLFLHLQPQNHKIARLRQSHLWSHSLFCPLKAEKHYIIVFFSRCSAPPFQNCDMCPVARTLGVKDRKSNGIGWCLNVLATKQPKNIPNTFGLLTTNEFKTLFSYMFFLSHLVPTTVVFARFLFMCKNSDMHCFVHGPGNREGRDRNDADWV